MLGAKRQRSGLDDSARSMWWLKHVRFVPAGHAQGAADGPQGHIVPYTVSRMDRSAMPTLPSPSRSPTQTGGWAS